MIQIEDMPTSEVEEMLRRISYGHLALSHNDQPYVVPIQYLFDGSAIYIYTTEGKKTKMIDSNPKVCLQVEEVVENDEWRSIIVNGDATRVSEPAEREKAIEQIRLTNPTLTPAISIRWIDSWIRENIEAVYKITPMDISGRSTAKLKINAAAAQPATLKVSEPPQKS